jgi:NADH-quinone oxidoreductase subunit G
MAEQKTVTFTINERKVTVPAGTLVIEATRRLGIEVPSFCYYPGLSLQAACRMCLVEVEKAPKLQTACTLVALEGMVVRTETEQVRQARKEMLEFLLTNHPLDCPVCDKGGECELQDMVFRYGADSSRFVEEKIHAPEEKWSPLVYYDAPRCILCFRCVRVCDEGMDVKALGVGQRGAFSTIIPNHGDHLECEECGMCIDICPVGALTSGTYRYQTRPWEMDYTGTVCAHCSNGCKTTLSVRNNEIKRANNRDLSGLNADFLCAKGRFGFDFVHHSDRLKQPLLWKNDRFRAVSWDEAFGFIAGRLREIRAAHGPDAIGFIGSNRTTNEENYLLQRLARAVVGTNNVDHHRTADYAGLLSVLGAQAAESLATLSQLGAAKAILLVGNNPTEQNPFVAWQMRTAVRNGGARFFAINSLPIKLIRKAKHFVHASEPEAAKWLAGSKVELSKGQVAALSELKSALEKESDVVIVFGAELRGRSIADLVKFGSSLAGRTRYLALGDYCNSRGAADMGLLPDFLPGYARVEDAAARTAFGRLWGAELPSQPGRDAQQMLEAAGDSLHALFVVGSNPVKSFGLRDGAALKGLSLLVVQDLFLTETAQLADVVLPALSAYEKDGTMTATSGEVQRVRKALETMGPRSDLDILRILSHQLAASGMGSAIALRSPQAVWEEIAGHVRGYQVSTANLLAGGAEMTACSLADGRAYDVPAELIRSAQDTLFTSGTLGRYCSMLRSVPEAQAEPEPAEVKG